MRIFALIVVILIGASPEKAPDLNTVSNASVPDRRETLLLHFCGRGSYVHSYSETVTFLIKNGADVNRRDWAHEENHPAHSGSSEYGFEWGDYCGRTPLIYAAISVLHGGDYDSMAKLLIEHGADTDVTDNFGQSVQDYLDYFK